MLIEDRKVMKKGYIKPSFSTLELDRAIAQTIGVGTGEAAHDDSNEDGDALSGSFDSSVFPWNED